jgi:hypothetical protein
VVGNPAADPIQLWPSLGLLTCEAARFRGLRVAGKTGGVGRVAVPKTTIRGALADVKNAIR